MISRRLRFKVRPNLNAAVRPWSASTQRQKVARRLSTSQHCLSTSSDTASEKCPDAVSTSASAITPTVAHSSPADTPSCSDGLRGPLTVNVEQSGRSTAPLKSPNDGGTVKPSSQHRHRLAHSPRFAVRSPWTMTHYGISKVRKKFTGNEPFNAKKMRMFDLISWNPKKEQGLKGSSLKRTTTIHSEETIAEGSSDQSRQVGKQTKPSAAPQVRIADDGSLVVDETSLTVVNDQPTTTVLETVSEDCSTPKVTSLSFRKTAWRKGTPWSERETDLFYEILQATGPDFGLMHEFFPLRARSELKSKFNREERCNWNRVKDVLANPSVLGNHLYETVSKEMNKIKEDEQNKKDKQGMKRTRKCAEAEVEWSEEGADLVAEAEAEIRRLMAEEKQSEEVIGKEKKGKQGKDNKVSHRVSRKMKSSSKAVDTNMQKKQRKKAHDGVEVLSVASRRRRSKGLVTSTAGSTSALSASSLDRPDSLAALSDDFPLFELIYEESRETVVLEADPNGGCPVVRLPVGTVLEVQLPNATEPERVFFRCPHSEGSQQRDYALQHQEGPAESSSGFLTLYGRE